MTMLGKFLRSIKNRIFTHGDDGATLSLFRQRLKSGSFDLERAVRMGPNHVHAFITHRDGSMTDLGCSKNLLTNIGEMVLRNAYGGGIPAGGAGSPATATSATSITATGTPWTASNLATPQLGLAGFRVYAPVTGLTTPPVYGNIVSNTTSVATIDKWFKADDTTGTTPASTNAFIIGAGGIGSIRFMALSADAGAAAATDNTLASEITTNSLGRALATYTAGANPSGGSGTFTLQKAFSPSGSQAGIVKLGLFVALSSAGADPMILEGTFSSASVINGDTLTCVSGDTKTLTRRGVHTLRELAGRSIEVKNRFGQWESATVESFGIQRLYRIDFAHLNPVFATADHRWWQKDGSRVPTSKLRRVPFLEGGEAEVKAITDTGRDEEVFCCVVPESESFTLANGLISSNCTDTITLSG